MAQSDWYVNAMQQLVAVVQELSRARNLKSVAAIVRQADRGLTVADGATFVLREDGECHYLEENAIGPLWKGRRFLLETCISGWIMPPAIDKLKKIVTDLGTVRIQLDGASERLLSAVHAN